MKTAPALAPAAASAKPSRTTASEAALQMIYALEMGGQSAEEIVAWYGHDHPLPPAVRNRATRLLEAVVTQQAEIERLITAHAKRWRLGRVSLVDRSLLKLAIAQILAQPGLATQVINESLKLSRRFSQPAATGFLHGVLDAIAAELTLPPPSSA